MLKKTVCVNILAGCLSLGAAAQEQGKPPTTTSTLEAIVETVSVTGFRPLALDDVTGSVTVLDEADLAVRLSPNPADQLRAVPGVAVSRSGGPGSLT